MIFSSNHKKFILKQALWIAGIAITLGACGNNNTQEGTATNTDTTTHSGHTTTENTATTATTTQPADTAGMAGKSMMSLMQSNINQMKAMQTTGNPDNDFAVMMKTHHMGALEMAQLEVAQGQEPQLKQMAQKLIDEQQREIAELNTFCLVIQPTVAVMPIIKR
jgi:uncharacterized protein (DUF305 family)